MRNFINIFSLLLIMFLSGVILGQSYFTPEGYWEVIDESNEVRSIAQIYIKNNRLYGKIVKAIIKPGAKKNRLCDKCKGDRKNQPILGMEFIWDFKKGNNKWIKGKILDPEKGKIYNCEMKLTENGQKLEVFGYIKILVKIGRNQVWNRTSKEKYPDVIE